MEDAVLFSLKGQVAIITMNRPQSLNSMNEALIDGLHEALTKVEKDPAIKCAVLTGNGKAFCAGGDLPFLETLADTAVKKGFHYQSRASCKTYYYNREANYCHGQWCYRWCRC
mgnify:CR=1 FL=1